MRVEEREGVVCSRGWRREGVLRFGGFSVKCEWSTSTGVVAPEDKVRVFLDFCG